jgi:hypothetical protein
MPMWSFSTTLANCFSIIGDLCLGVVPAHRRNIPTRDIDRFGVVRSAWVIEYVRYLRCCGRFRRAENSGSHPRADFPRRTAPRTSFFRPIDKRTHLLSLSHFLDWRCHTTSLAQNLVCNRTAATTVSSRCTSWGSIHCTSPVRRTHGVSAML